MPNIANRGLWGARADGTWCAPSAVFGALEDGTWCSAAYVWAWCGAADTGSWQLIWGAAPAAPAAVTAAWVQPATVRITWTPPEINTNTQWIVRRSDGSIVATVPVGTTTVVDSRPLLASTVATNTTIGAYTVEGSDGAASSARVASNTLSVNLAPATQATAVTYPTSTTSTVTVTWTPNATHGAPQGWRIWETSQAAWVSDVLAGTATSAVIANQGRGVARNYRAVPFTQTAAGAWVQAGNAADAPANLAAIAPPSMTLVALSSPLSTLRGTWTAPGGSRTGFEVQTSTNGTTWAALRTVTTLTTDWSTTVAGYMRVRTTSAGGPSDWTQAGPTTPINDTTGPGPSTITSFKPESSYGRLVVRGNWSTASDTARGQILVRNLTTGGAWTTVWGAGTVAPGAAFSTVTNTGAANNNYQVLVRTWDAAGNMNTADATATYALIPATVTYDANGSGTWRGSVWRTDSVSGSTGVMHGRTTSGENYGCWFYNMSAIRSQLAGRTIVSSSIQYNRDGSSQGASAAIQPQLWMHNKTAASGAAPTFANGGTTVLGTGVARSGTTGGSASIPNAWWTSILAGTYHGFGVYRYTTVTADANAASFYMRLYPYGTSSGGTVSGRLTVNTLG